ncbi:MAG: hypothetical protein HIU86_08945 [Acidobacteria bacterium]|nr:hypothetical protein [Acidobacteriota bacterium]
MTKAAAGPDSPSVDGVAWRALASGLWVARRDGRHLGTVQKGRRWLATDVDGEPIGTFRSFSEAQAAVVQPQPPRAPAPRTSLTAPAVALAALGVAAIVSSASWAAVSFLL